jgi:hypothetical protein
VRVGRLSIVGDGCVGRLRGGWVGVGGGRSKGGEDARVRTVRTVRTVRRPGVGLW